MYWLVVVIPLPYCEIFSIQAVNPNISSLPVYPILGSEAKKEGITEDIGCGGEYNHNTLYV